MARAGLLAHVKLVELFDGAVVQAIEFGNCLVRHVAAELAHMQGKALRIARVAGQPVEAFYMHAAAPRAVPPHLGQLTRQRSNSRWIRNPATERSRTRQVHLS